MTDIETAIMIKNMAREAVRRMTAKNTNSILQQMADKYLKEYARLRGLVDAARKDVDKAYAEKNYKKADDAQKRLNKADADLQKLERDRSKLDARVDTRWDFLK